MQHAACTAAVMRALKNRWGR